MPVSSGVYRYDRAAIVAHVRKHGPVSPPEYSGADWDFVRVLMDPGPQVADQQGRVGPLRLDIRPEGVFRMFEEALLPGMRDVELASGRWWQDGSSLVLLISAVTRLHHKEVEFSETRLQIHGEGFALPGSAIGPGWPPLTFLPLGSGP